MKPHDEPEEKPQPETPAEDTSKGVQGGVAGGVEGGVVGGVAGGVVGGTGTGAPPKPKNVPAFVIQRDVLQQDPIRLSEVFKAAHRGGPTITGMYKVCVALDGRVYEVTPVKKIPGADDDIISGIKDGWRYKPQQVPICFLYSIPITIQ